MKNEEITNKFSAIEKSIADLRKDVDILRVQKQNTDKVNAQIKLTLENSEYSALLVESLKSVHS